MISPEYVPTAQERADTLRLYRRLRGYTSTPAAVMAQLADARARELAIALLHGVTMPAPYLRRYAAAELYVELIEQRLGKWDGNTFRPIAIRSERERYWATGHTAAPIAVRS